MEKISYSKVNNELKDKNKNLKEGDTDNILNYLSDFCARLKVGGAELVSTRYSWTSRPLLTSINIDYLVKDDSGGDHKIVRVKVAGRATSSENNHVHIDIFFNEYSENIRKIEDMASGSGFLKAEFYSAHAKENHSSVHPDQRKNTQGNSIDTRVL